MYKFPLLLLLIAANFSSAQTALSFKTNRVDTFYGKVVHDPYRLLEDTGNANVKAWMKQQALHTEAFFASMPGRKKLYDDIIAANNRSKLEEINSVLVWKEKYYVTKRKPGQENFSLYEIDAAGNEKLLIDPGTAFPEIKSKNVMISFFDIMRERSELIYGLTIGGNETEPKLIIQNMETGKQDFDTLYLTKQRSFNSFDPGRKDAFYYDCLPLYKKANVDPMHWWDSATVKYHVTGTDPKEDKNVIGFSDSVIKREADDGVIFIVEKNLPYAFVVIKNKVADEFRIYVVPKKDLHNAHIPWQQLTDFDDKISQYAMKDNYLYLLSNKNASNSKVLRIDLHNPSLKNATVLVPHSKTILTKIDVTKNELLVSAIAAGQGKLLRIAHGSTQIDTLPTPVDGFIDLVWCHRDDATIVIQIHSWTRLIEYFSYNAGAKKFEHCIAQHTSNENNVQLEVKEVLVKSYDGVEVPMTIIYKKGLTLDGTHPVMFDGYGAYGFQDEPRFWPEAEVWFNYGGIRAYAHIRGGGAYGEEWHTAGQKATKPNTWKDFIACAEYLIEYKYATAKTLIASGGSAGGINIGRAITERPDLFGAANISVGALDMIRMETTPNGAGNIPEFGSLKTEEGFKALYEMSAYHHVKDGVKYPAVLFSHGINDTRVAVWMSLKMAASMQAATASGQPVLLKLDFDSGHGFQSNMTTIFNDAADNYSWCFRQAGMKDFQPVSK